MNRTHTFKGKRSGKVYHMSEDKGIFSFISDEDLNAQIMRKGWQKVHGCDNMQEALKVGEWL